MSRGETRKGDAVPEADDRLKICLLLLSAGEGGLERHVIDLAKGLSERGHEVAVIGNAWLSGRLAPGVKLIEVDTRRSRSNPFLLLAVLRAVRSFAPHVLHAHARKAIRVAARLRPFLRCRAVGSIHNNRARRDAALRRLDRVVCVSREIQEQIGAHADTVVIYNGIAPPLRVPEAAPVPEPEGGRVYRILAVGRLVESKGFDLLIEAVAGMRDYVLWIAGEGPEHDRLVSRIDALNLAGQVHLLGQRDDVPALMAMADLLVIPSRSEGFSYVFAEALMSRLLVVSTDVPVPNEVLPAELLSPREHPGELARRIEFVRAADAASIEHWKDALHTFATGQFSLQAMITRTEALYREVADGGRA